MVCELFLEHYKWERYQIVASGIRENNYFKYLDVLYQVDMIENYHHVYGVKRFIFSLLTIYLYSPIDICYVDGKQKQIGYRLLIDKAHAVHEIRGVA